MRAVSNRCGQYASHLAEIALTEDHVLSVVVFADDEFGGINLAGMLRNTGAHGVNSAAGR